MVSDFLGRLFPNLGDCVETSPQDASYNCFAWALRRSDRWVSPEEYGDCFWPEGVSRKRTLESFVALFSVYGFSVCDDPSREEGVEKVALYADATGRPTHAARQLPNGKWTSKLEH